MPGNQPFELEFVAGIETAGAAGCLLAQQAVGAHHLAARGEVRHQQMIANFIEAVGVTLVHLGRALAARAHFLAEDPEPQFLGQRNLGRITRKAYLEGTDTPQGLIADNGGHRCKRPICRRQETLEAVAHVESPLSRRMPRSYETPATIL